MKRALVSRWAWNAAAAASALLCLGTACLLALSYRTPTWVERFDFTYPSGPSPSGCVSILHRTFVASDGVLTCGFSEVRRTLAFQGMHSEAWPARMVGRWSGPWEARDPLDLEPLPYQADGFEVARSDQASDIEVYHERYLGIPLWTVASAAALLPAAWSFAWLRRARAARAGGFPILTKDAPPAGEGAA